jgi:Fe(3+) dicitrate transport protein
MKSHLHILALILAACLLGTHAQAQFHVGGQVLDASNGRPIAKANVVLEPGGMESETDAKGRFSFEGIAAGPIVLSASSDLFPLQKRSFALTADMEFEFRVDSVGYLMETVELDAARSNVATLRSIDGMGIYAARKTELIQLDRVSANLATNNARQVFMRVAGLNIWESDGGGLQLGIGGRGLSPNRTANFNTRQNGYDIAADALGYPESYYTPPTEALKRIEVVRGAASLQYGTQFGGMLNFVFREGPENRKAEVVSRQTLGSFGLFNSFNSVGGTLGKTRYYTFYQGKRGDGWRPNSGFQQHTAYISLSHDLGKRVSIGAEYTFMDYLAQQPGGLTDALFNQDPRQSIRARNWFAVRWNLASLSTDIVLGPHTRLNMRNFGLLASRKSLGFLGSINRVDPGAGRDLISGEFRNIGSETRLLHKYQFLGQPSALVAGVRLYAGHSTNQQGSAPEGSGPDFSFDTPDGTPNLSDHVFPSSNHAFFLENLFHFGPRWSVTPGLRLEYIRTSSQGSYQQRVLDLAGNVIFEQTLLDQSQRTRAFALAGLGVGYKVAADVELYGNLSRNYRAITFNDLRIVNPNFRIDPNLQDEKGYSSDLGLRGKAWEWLEFDLSLFALAYQNRIGQVLAADSITFQSYRYRTNIGSSLNLGVEAYAEADLLKAFGAGNPKTSLVLFMNGSMIRAKYISSQEKAFEGKDVELVPPFTLKGGLAWRTGGLRLSLQHGYTAQQFSDATNAAFSPNAVEGLIPAYSVMDCSGSYEWRFLRLEAGCNNVLNSMYFTRRAVAYPGPGIMPSDGRSAYVCVQVKI